MDWKNKILKGTCSVILSLISVVSSLLLIFNTLQNAYSHLEKRSDIINAYKIRQVNAHFEYNFRLKTKFRATKAFFDLWIGRQNDELKNIAQIEHSRHRPFHNFVGNLLSGIAAYCFFPKKPTINVHKVVDRQLTLF